MWIWKASYRPVLSSLSAQVSPQERGAPWTTPGVIGASLHWAGDTLQCTYLDADMVVLQDSFLIWGCDSLGHSLDGDKSGRGACMSVAALNKIPLSLNGREVVCGGPPALRHLMGDLSGES